MFRYEADEFNGGFGKVPEDGFGSFTTGWNHQQVQPCPLFADRYRSGQPPTPREGPMSDIRSSLDHLIGGVQEFVRDAEAERLGGLEVDRELERRRLLDRQLGWIGAV